MGEYLFIKAKTALSTCGFITALSILWVGMQTVDAI